MTGSQPINKDLNQLADSQAKFREYPLNLVRTADFPYILKTYKSRLESDETRYFNQGKAAIKIWDLMNTYDRAHVSRSATKLNELKNVLSETTFDPCRRLIFLKSGTSRAPLDCSREMLAYLLTHHQIMARFLDFTTTFKFRETPHSFASFKNESFLDSDHHQPGLLSIGRSGIRIQHCFNVLGIERSRDSTSWMPRQVAAYHSLHIVQGRALWIVLKGDGTMRKRLETATEESAQKEAMSLDTLEGALSQTLKDHLLILQWCVENWDLYTEDLEEKYRELSRIAEYAPVTKLADDIGIRRKRDKALALLSGSPQVNGSMDPTDSPGIIRRLTKRATTGFSTVTQVDPPKPNVEDHKIEDLVQFERMQSLSALDTTPSEAISIIEQNRGVLAEIKEYYQSLVNSTGFRLHTSDKATLKACKEAVSGFSMKINRFEGGLGNYQGNLKTLLRGVERTESIYNGILQYQSMRTAEYFASSAEDSAEIMQVWTKEMHTKTISMHAITVFTLIFLPGTFVATIFSSGILTFGDDGSAGFGSSMGAWKVRVAGLKLYFSICLPLLALTLLAWLGAYCYARSRGSRNRRHGGADHICRKRGDDHV